MTFQFYWQTMSRYDLLRKRQNRLQLVNQSVRFIPTVALLTLVTFNTWNSIPLLTLSLCCFGLLVLPSVFGFAIKLIFPTYRRLLAELHQVESEIIQLGNAIRDLYMKYRERNQGEQFKRTYDLIGKSIAECEERLAVGMSREHREVFVNCFVKGDEVVRVTASIGSIYRCAPSDNPYRWKQHFERLGCTEIRQYHNHPVNNNRTSPSPFDHKTSLSIKQLLGKHGSKLKSYIIYWNQINEWRIIEYDELGKFWLAKEFDIAAKRPIRVDN